MRLILLNLKLNKKKVETSQSKFMEIDIKIKTTRWACMKAVS